MKKLWYTREATAFTEALPIGNGRLGGMVYGGVGTEKISLNEDTLWSGYPRDKAPKDAYSGITQAKILMKEGKIAEAEDILWKNSLGEWTEAYQPAGSLLIHFPEVGQAEGYRRELSLDEAIASTEFQSSGYTYRREAAASCPDQVMALSFVTENPGSRAILSLDTPHKHSIIYRENTLYLIGQAPAYAAPSYMEDEKDPVRYDAYEENRALTYAIGLLVKVNNGSTAYEGGKLSIYSNDFTVYIDIETNFEGFRMQPKESRIDVSAAALRRLEKAAAKEYAQFRAEHIEDYKRLFDMMELTLCGQDKPDIPTDRRLEEYQTDKSDSGLAVLLFDYGRYLTIASSREGTQPMNLQGIWNEEVRPPWSSNYTININAQMNYWHVEACNLPECHLPFLNMIRELAENGKKTARDNYHCGGWCSHHNTDIWRQSEPVGREGRDSGAVGFGFWNGSGGWLARHIWEHYEYTQDADFLEEYWEVLLGAAQFYLDWLEEDGTGRLITPVTTSPENHYSLDGHSYVLSRGCAMDTGILMDVFTICRKAGEVLGKEAEVHAKLSEALSKLKQYEIGPDGCILEWDKEYGEPERGHRHLSPLYGVYPADSIHKDTPEWYEAARKLMIKRGEEATGWSFGWKANVWARLHDGERAKLFIDNILRPVTAGKVTFGSGGGVYINLLDAHPPFQIDGNFGITAAITEMLVQDRNDNTELLPALPKEWAAGSVRGLRLRGGREISFSWTEGRAESVEYK